MYIHFLSTKNNIMISELGGGLPFRYSHAPQLKISIKSSQPLRKLFGLSPKHSLIAKIKIYINSISYNV